MGSKTSKSRGAWRVIAVAAVLAVPLLAPASPADAAVATVRVSVATGGGQSAGGAFTTSPSMSADGKVIAFASSATNLVPNDNNAAPDIFVHDRSTGTTTRVSVASNGAEANGSSTNPAISADGRYVAYHSTATNLVAGDTNGQTDVFVYDRQTGTTKRVDVKTGGAEAGTGTAAGASQSAAISGDGRYVAYQSAATDLVAGDTNGQTDIFVTDTAGSFTTTRVSVATGGGQGCVPASPCGANQGAGASTLPAISRDGRFVSYTSASRILVPSDSNGAIDIFVTDTTGSLTTTRVSVATGGGQALNGGSNASALSADGSIVVYSSEATNLVPNDTNSWSDVFAYDRSSGTTTRVSVTSTGGQAQGPSVFPSISGDGRTVVYDSSAPNLVAGDSNGENDVFLYDRFTGATTRASLTSGGGEGNAGSFFGKVSDNARYATYATESSNLVLGDTNTTSDIFVTDLQAPEPVAAGYRLAASDGGVFAFGTARFLGSLGGTRLAAPIVGMAATPSGNGYWMVAADGGIFAFGDATFVGSAGNLRLNRPIVGMAVTPSGRGYWLVASDGGIFSFGDAAFKGSTGALRLNQPIVGMAATSSGNGYWLVASDGGVFAFGDAKFRGSTGGQRLNRPVVGMAAAPSGSGYWLVAADGGIFAFNTGFFGSTGAIRLARPVVGMAGTPGGRGYYLVASDGGVFAFGDAVFKGSTGGIRLAQPIVGLATS